MQWADARVWDAVLATPAAGDDPRTRELLHHLHLVQRLYLQLWRGEPLAPGTPGDFPDLPAMRAWARAFHEEAAALLHSLDSARLAAPIDFPWADQLRERFGAVHPVPLEDSVLQVVLHTAHHRGQLCTRLRELGAEPPLIDYVAWLWEGAPAPAWPEPTPE